MRKVLLLVLIVFTTLPINAQQRDKFETVNPIYHELLPIENDVITYYEIVEVEGMSKSQLYFKLLDWVRSIYKPLVDDLFLESAETNKIIYNTKRLLSAGKGWNKSIMDIYFTITIDVKDGRYRIKATDFINKYDLQLGSVGAKGESNLENYFLLKEPKKKELEVNMEMAENIRLSIEELFSLAYTYVGDLDQINDDDDW